MVLNDAIVTDRPAIIKQDRIVLSIILLDHEAHSALHCARAPKDLTLPLTCRGAKSFYSTTVNTN
jgi:hypothetical protein